GRRRGPWNSGGDTPVTGLQIRPATTADAGVLHALISAHRSEGRLLPREPGEIARHADRFVVCEVDGIVKPARRCGQYAMVSPLREVLRFSAAPAVAARAEAVA